MLFEIERDVFFDGLAKATPITEKKSTLPILSHVLMDVSDSWLTLTATDLAVGLRQKCDCNVMEPGMLAIPCRKLFEFVRELPAGTIRVELREDGRITLLQGKSVFQLASMDPLDYPAWSSFDDAPTVAMPAEQLLNMIEKAYFAASSDESRFNLNAVLFENADDVLKMVATDGHRLALIEQPVQIAFDAKILVPKRGLLELKRVLEGLKGEVQLGFEPKNMFIRTDRFMMTLRLVEGDYPDYRKVIPEGGQHLVKFNRSELLQTLKRVAVLTSERNKGITVEVNPGEMELTAFHPDLGNIHDVVSVEFSGEPFSFVINVAYLAESLSAVDTETVSFDFTKEGAPIIVRPEPRADYFNLVMPMRK